MTRLVPDNTETILALMGQSGKFRTCSDDKEFFLLLKEKVVRDIERMFSEKTIPDKTNALIDLYNDLDEFKLKLADKVDWGAELERRTNYTGGYEKRIILEDVKAGDEKVGNATELLAWGKSNNYPAMVLAFDEFNVPYKVLGKGEVAWQNWIDAYENNPENLGELASAVRKDNRYGEET